MEMWQWQLFGFVVLMAVVAGMGWRQSRRVRLLEEGHEAELDQLRRLPVLPLPGEGQQTCEGCQHWDLEEGQAQFAEHPAFLQVTQMVSPAKMSQRAEVDNNGNLLMNGDGDVVKTEPGIPYKARWHEFGACSRHSEARWKDDKCDDHTPRALAVTNTAGVA